MADVPALGARGGGWVALQFLLIATILTLGLLAPGWPDGARWWLKGGGALLVFGGAFVIALAGRALGSGFTPFPHPSSPPASDVMRVRVGLDPGLALKTRKGTGYYKVPSLRGLWYRGPFEHSGSIVSLEEWFDAARFRDDYVPKGWNPPDTRARPIPGSSRRPES